VVFPTHIPDPSTSGQPSRSLARRANLTNSDQALPTPHNTTFFWHSWKPTDFAAPLLLARAVEPSSSRELEWSLREDRRIPALIQVASNRVDESIATRNVVAAAQSCVSTRGSGPQTACRPVGVIISIRCRPRRMAGGLRAATALDRGVSSKRAASPS